MPQTHYQTLGVDQDATAAEIRKAYHRRALQAHPDKNNNSAASNAEFKQINIAYDILKDAEKRKLYDNQLKNGIPTQPMARPQASPSANTQATIDPAKIQALFAPGHKITVTRVTDNRPSWANNPRTEASFCADRNTIHMTERYVVTDTFQGQKTSLLVESTGQHCNYTPKGGGQDALELLIKTAKANGATELSATRIDTPQNRAQEEEVAKVFKQHGITLKVNWQASLSQSAANNSAENQQTGRAELGLR